jgi:hypothetical protein
MASTIISILDSFQGHRMNNIETIVNFEQNLIANIIISHLYESDRILCNKVLISSEQRFDMMKRFLNLID